MNNAEENRIRNIELGRRNEEIVASYLAGTPSLEISKKHNISRQRVSQILFASGIDPMKNYVKFNRTKKGLTVQKANELVSKGLSKRQIASALGMCRETITAFFNENGLQFNAQEQYCDKTKQRIILMMRGKNNREASAILDGGSKSGSVCCSILRRKVRENRFNKTFLELWAKEIDMPYEVAVKTICTTQSNNEAR